MLMEFYQKRNQFQDMKNKSFRINGTMVLFLLPVSIFAQNATDAVNPHNYWENLFGSVVLLAGAIVILAALVAIVRLFTLIVKMEELRVLQEKGINDVIEHYKQPQESWWKKFMKTATQYVPVEKEKDILFEHDYDGIRELDNRLPPWWLWLFYVTIIFSAIYFTAYHIFDGPSLIDEYNKEVEVAQAKIDEYLATKAEAVNEDNVTVLNDEESLSLGQSTFETLCMPCHGMHGEGNTIGPNLTDDYWLHGCDIKNVFNTISNGVIEKGMQSWKSQLRPVEIQRVASYILVKLHGSNPANAKAPQGEPCTVSLTSDASSAPSEAVMEEAPPEPTKEN